MIGRSPADIFGAPFRRRRRIAIAAGVAAVLAVTFSLGLVAAAVLL